MQPPDGRDRCSEPACTTRTLRFPRAVHTRLTAARYVLLAALMPGRDIRINDADETLCIETVLVGRLKFQVQHFSPLQTRVFCQNTGSRNFCTINGLLGCPSIRCANSRSLEVLHLTLETAVCTYDT
ncbi:conserved hypothetical protein [Xanthomonas oryzae pv. oryzae MAFF 311018]|nr:conserved hypothetical protein [Xanthomonas oryzae pv. oryzae MAFF 311018]